MEKKKYKNANKAAQTRQSIIEKTAPVFNRKGYMGTSMKDLTEATGLTKGSIYGNFKDKDAVALAAFEYNYQGVISFIQYTLSKKEKIAEKLLGITAAYRGMYPTLMERGGCPILNTGIDAADINMALQKRSKEAIAEIMGLLIQLIKAGIKRGEVQADTNAEHLAGLIFTLIQGGIFMSKTMGDMMYLDNVLGQVDVLIRDVLRDGFSGNAD